MPQRSLNTQRILVLAHVAVLDQTLILAQKVGLTTYGVITAKGVSQALKSLTFDHFLLDASAPESGHSVADILNVARELHPPMRRMVMLKAAAKDRDLAKAIEDGAHHAFRGPLGSTHEFLEQLNAAHRSRMIVPRSAVPSPALKPSANPPAAQVPTPKKRGRPPKQVAAPASVARRGRETPGDKAIKLVQEALQADMPLDDVVEAVELAIIEKAFERHDSYRAVSAALRVSRQTIVNRMKKLQRRPQ